MGSPARSIKMRCEVPADRVLCAHLAVGFALDAGMRRTGAWELGIAVAELVSNMTRHAGGGELMLRVIDGPPRAVEVVARDRGRGIGDLTLAMRDGWSNGAARHPDSKRDGLGSGLGAVTRLMSEISFESGEAECGTTVIARKWLPGPGR